MGGHAHDEVMDVVLTASDILVLILLVIMLFLAGMYILKRLRNQCIKCIQKEIQKEMDSAAVTQQKTMKVVRV